MSDDPRPGRRERARTLRWTGSTRYTAPSRRSPLGAAARHGFALGGSNALLFHGIINRTALDVNLLTDCKTGIRAAAGPVCEALRADGFTLQPDSQTDGLVGWTVTGHGGRHRELRLASSPRSRDPLLTEAGPVVHLEDAAGGKVCTLALRGQVRDYTDTAALLGRWIPAELADFARRLDPALPPATWPSSLGGWTGCPIRHSARTAWTSRGYRTSGPPWSRNGSPRDPRAISRAQGRVVRTPASRRRATLGRARDDTPDCGR